MASGWSTIEIAGHLLIAPTTVKAHVSRILTKIGARSRVQAVAFAYESGLRAPHTTRSPLPSPGTARPTPSGQSVQRPGQSVQRRRSREEEEP